jgi:Glyoxalase-like domain
MTIQWMFAFIDRPAAGFEAATAFWSTVLKWTVSSRRGHDELVTLLPPDRDAYVKVQAVSAGGGMHLDLAVSDVSSFCSRQRTRSTVERSATVRARPLGLHADSGHGSALRGEREEDAALPVSWRRWTPVIQRARR